MNHFSRHSWHFPLSGNSNFGICGTDGPDSAIRFAIETNDVMHFVSRAEEEGDGDGGEDLAEEGQ
jgi:hypothetical protein